MYIRELTLDLGFSGFRPLCNGNQPPPPPDFTQCVCIACGTKLHLCRGYSRVVQWYRRGPRLEQFQEPPQIDPISPSDTHIQSPQGFYRWHQTAPPAPSLSALLTYPHRSTDSQQEGGASTRGCGLKGYMAPVL
uniref:Uncharacterized protein n=1 Tax=Xenopus tropicalis TaxID=8364 RepID=A0A1B8XVD5_XENTR